MSDNPNAFKHQVHQDLLDCIAKSIQKPYPGFNKKQLLLILPELEKRELKQRAYLVRDELHRQPPAESSKTLRILLS